MEIEKNVYKRFYSIFQRIFVDIEFPKNAWKKTSRSKTSEKHWNEARSGTTLSLAVRLTNQESRYYYRFKTDYNTFQLSVKDMPDEIVINTLKWLGSFLSERYIDDNGLSEPEVAKILFQFFWEQYDPDFLEENVHLKCFEEGAIKKPIKNPKGNKSKKQNKIDEAAIPLVSNFNPLDEQPTLTFETLADEDVLRTLNLFTLGIKRNLTKKEHADLYYTKVKLYELLFSDYDQISKEWHHSDIADVIFERLLSNPILSTVDFDTINKIRNVSSYSSAERLLLVSGLTLSVFKKFEHQKFHLLIDFVTDNEDKVWQTALTGLILGLLKYENRLSAYPEMSRRLEGLKEQSKIQKGLLILQDILVNELYIVNEIDSERVIDSFKVAIENNDTPVTLDEAFFNNINAAFNRVNQSKSDQIICEVINKDIFEALNNKFRENGAFTIHADEMFELGNFLKYTQLHNLNPLMLDLSEPFYKSAKNWFKPFIWTNELTDILDLHFPQGPVSLKEFKEVIELEEALPIIDKCGVIFFFSEADPGFLQYIYVSLKRSIIESQLRQEEAEKRNFLNIVRNLYRFQKLGVHKEIQLSFSNRLTNYQNSLLDKVGGNLTAITIQAQACYERKEYDHCIELILAIPEFSKNLALIEIAFHSYFFSGKMKEAFDVCDDFIKSIINSSDISSPTKLLRLYALCKLMEEINHWLGVRIIMDKMIHLTKASVQKNIKAQFPDEVLLESIRGFYYLLNMRSDICYQNEEKDLVEAFYYRLLAIDVVFIFPKLHDLIFKKIIQPNNKFLFYFLHKALITEKDPEIFELPFKMTDEVSLQLKHLVSHLIKDLQLINDILNNQVLIDFVFTDNIAYKKTNKILDQIRATAEQSSDQSINITFKIQLPGKLMLPMEVNKSALSDDNADNICGWIWKSIRRHVYRSLSERSLIRFTFELEEFEPQSKNNIQVRVYDYLRKMH